jgi:hypothetical protein
MESVMQRLAQLEQKIDYLISLQDTKPKIQPQINTFETSPFIMASPVNNSFYQQNIPPRMPGIPDYPERMFPTGVEPQRFGALTRGSNKS